MAKTKPLWSGFKIPLLAESQVPQFETCHSAQVIMKIRLYVQLWRPKLYFLKFAFIEREPRLIFRPRNCLLSCLPSRWRIIDSRHHFYERQLKTLLLVTRLPLEAEKNDFVLYIFTAANKVAFSLTGWTNFFGGISEFPLCHRATCNTSRTMKFF